MANEIPKRIYLQMGDIEPDEIDSVDWSEVAWRRESQYKNDIEYIRASPLRATCVDCEKGPLA